MQIVLPDKILGESCRIGFSLPNQGDRFYNGRMDGHVTKNSDDQILNQLQDWGRELGFSQIGVTGVDLSTSEPELLDWLAKGFHGDMHYMAAHGLKRARPAELIEGTVSVITARMDYLPEAIKGDWREIEDARLARPSEAVISVYSRGRDYHKVMRARLQKLSDKLATLLDPLGARVFVDSAPVLEVELASRSGLGWRGKHTLLLNREAGSMFFLGEIFVDRALHHTPTHTAIKGAIKDAHCGTCTACMAVCPTKAIIAPYQLDARRCISYLTIEHKGAIPIEFRAAMGNRMYGCDDCQTICPWNKYAKRSTLPDFDVRPHMQDSSLMALFAWSEDEFLQRTEGSAIRRIGHERWLRNIAVALGNAVRSAIDLAEKSAIKDALRSRLSHESALVQEHVAWALAQ